MRHAGVACSNKAQEIKPRYQISDISASYLDHTTSPLNTKLGTKRVPVRLGGPLSC
jgi:hypothetical protein